MPGLDSQKMSLELFLFIGQIIQESAIGVLLHVGESKIVAVLKLNLKVFHYVPISYNRHVCIFLAFKLNFSQHSIDAIRTILK